ncbi:hypothetical protein [Sulfurimonas sp. C5]|uniref:hypothetical protein n=1 Tax=Sulfurimonas sp. C5 TaxID=3036947 RepID=UPI002456B7AA|nr:hypothetical protein [Sulfurimonas sp. C5]MDH4945502.1 hypothetical protein [Sulfurimonas sp. C5]
MKKKPYKKFVFFTILIVILFSLYHLYIYTFYTSKIFDRKDYLYIGDIARVGYQVDALYPRKLEYTLPKKHLNKEQYTSDKKIDILTLGDSFSNAATGGKNPYYQDYLATDYNASVLNILDTRDHSVNTFKPVIALYNNGWLKQHHVKFVIIQSVERFCVQRYAKKFDYSFNDIDINKVIRSSRQYDSYIPKINFISTANYKFPYYNYQSKKKVHFHPDVMLLELNKNLFSPENFSDKLLIHHEDILSLPYNTQENIFMLNQNLNHLAILLKSIDVKLIFMPTVDKYDLYYPYIKNNPYRKNLFFKIIRKLPKEYIFIDTKKILEQLLLKGTLNVYYPDDSHWSELAIKAIINENFTFLKKALYANHP